MLSLTLMAGLPLSLFSLHRKKSAHIHSRTHRVRDQPCFKQFLQNQKNTMLQRATHFSGSGLYLALSFFLLHCCISLYLSSCLWSLYFLLSDCSTCWCSFFHSDSAFINSRQASPHTHTNLVLGIVGSPEVAVLLLCRCLSPALWRGVKEQG